MAVGQRDGTQRLEAVVGGVHRLARALVEGGQPAANEEVVELFLYGGERGTGGLDGASYEEIRYEGYGVGGAAVIVDCMTDNRTRTVAEVRHAFSKHGGNLGTDGSVAFMFRHCGQLLFAPGTPEDRVMEAAIDAGAEDVISDDEGGLEVITSTADFGSVKAALEKAGLKADVAEITMRPENPAPLLGDDAAAMQKLLDALENLDDVQQVFTNAEFDETS